MIVCSHCNFHNEQGVAICENCENPLPETQTSDRGPVTDPDLSVITSNQEILKNKIKELKEKLRTSTVEGEALYGRVKELEPQLQASRLNGETLAGKVKRLEAELHSSTMELTRLKHQIAKIKDGREPTSSPGLNESPSSNLWDSFVEKLPMGIGKNWVGKVLKSFLNGSTKSLGPRMLKILGQRWGGWSVIATLVASLSGLTYMNMGPQAPDGVAAEGPSKSSKMVGVTRVEGKMTSGEKYVVEKGQFSANAIQSGGARVSGQWPPENCVIRPVMPAGAPGVIVKQPTEGNLEMFSFQLEENQEKNNTLRTIYFLWDCTDK